MAQRIVPAAALGAVASPVDTFAAPHMERDGWGELAESLSRVNPKLQNIIKTQYARKAEGDAAAGAVAADSVPASVALNENKKGWQGLVAEVRKRDAEQGTNNADQLVGASPHFQRGLVQARAKRVGMGFQSYLQQQWMDDVGGVKNIDDPKAMQEWVSQQTKAYTEKAGVKDIDPLIVAETFSPYVAQSQETLMSKHMTYRSQMRLEAYGQEFDANVGLLLAGAGNGASSVDDWIARMTVSESGGDSTVINDLGYGGLLQFGQERLNDYNNAFGTKITVREFAANKALQHKVNLWHVKDLDAHIAKRGYVGRGYSLDGLRAVAHLGGKGGLDKYIQSGGRYDPDDGYVNKKGKRVKGTKLSDYYKKFAGNAGAVQREVDQAVSYGVDPKAVNERLVSSVVAQAEATQNPALLNVLDQIDTGNGPLGNISWVKAKRTAALGRIESAQIRAEEREYRLEQRAKTAEREALLTEGFSTIFNDPEGDHEELIKSAAAGGNPEIASRLHNLQRQLQNESKEIDTDHGAYIRLRNEIFQGNISKGELSTMIVEGVESSVFSSSMGASLFDDLDRAEGVADFMRDPQVQNWIGNTTSVIADKNEVKNWEGNVIVSGKEVAAEAELEMTEEILLFLEENEGASPARVRKFVRELSREMLKRPEYAGQSTGFATSSTTQLESDGGVEASNDPLAGFTDQQVALAAEANGMTVVEYIAAAGSTRRIEPQN